MIKEEQKFETILLFVHTCKREKNLSELKWFPLAVCLFFNFKEFVLGLCYLDSFKFYLFPGFWEARGQDTDYFLTFFPVTQRKAGQQLCPTLGPFPVPGPTVRLQRQEMLP